MIRIALLGNAAGHAERLSRLLGVEHQIFTIDNLPEERIDVMIGIRFGEAEARKLQPRMLHLPGAGADLIDREWLPRDCVMCNVFEHEVPIAEYVMLAMLDWEIGYSAMTEAFTPAGWGNTYFSRKPHGELAGKTIGLVGAGHIGEAIARRAAAFGMQTVAIASRARDVTDCIQWIGDRNRLGELLAISDYVVIACPLTDKTRGMIGGAELALMKPTAVVINVARGEIVDEEPFFSALKQGRIRGAVLDAWYNYPAGPNDQVEPSRFPFSTLENVRATPHASAWTIGLFERRYTFIAANIARFAQGQPPANVIHMPEGSACRS